MEGWAGLVGWPIADTLPTRWSRVNCRSTKVHQPKTNVTESCSKTKYFKMFLLDAAIGNLESLQCSLRHCSSSFCWVSNIRSRSSSVSIGSGLWNGALRGVEGCSKHSGLVSPSSSRVFTHMCTHTHYGLSISSSDVHKRPSYLVDDPWSARIIFAQCHHHNWSSVVHGCWLSATELFQLLLTLRVWNELPHHLTSEVTLLSFLQTQVFCHSVPNFLKHVFYLLASAVKKNWTKTARQMQGCILALCWQSVVTGWVLGLLKASAGGGKKMVTDKFVRHPTLLC